MFSLIIIKKIQLGFIALFMLKFFLFTLVNYFNQKILLKKYYLIQVLPLLTFSDKYKKNKNNIILTSNYI